jgi:photosystem II stability/assembly factor-like uncharacterized protein
MTRLTALIILCVLCGAVYAADDSWKQPLAVKEQLLEQNARERHNILGLYPSQVEAPLQGGPVDNSTLGIGNIAHSVCWTANYLAGCSFRYASLKKSGAPAEQLDAAKARADEVFEAVYRCQLVTGVPGLQARGYALGHGESYEERWGDRTSNEWHQGVGEYSELRWRGDPSHHNYSDASHGLMQYWRLAAEGPQKDRARDAIDSLVGYWVDNDFKIYDYDRSKLPVPILGFSTGEVLDTRILMAIAAAKYAHVVTGKEKFKAAYDQLTQKAGLRGMKVFAFEKDYDDAEHCFCHLENLMNVETDPELLAAYRLILDTMWKHYTEDAQSLFTSIYAGLTPNAPELEKPLKDALRSLQTWPTDTTLKPRMSSLDPRLKPPYPLYAAAWDNEYIWKGHLRNPDGWLSKIITGVAVPAEDPMVVYAIDQNGVVYQSRDGAATPGGWRPIDQGLPSPARAIDAGPRVRMIYAACDDGFYMSTTGGYDWQRLPVPGDGGKPANIEVAPDTSNTLYTITTRGIYRSPDFGEEFLGQTWETLTSGLPTGKNAHYHVAHGNPGRLYAVLDNLVFTRRLDEPAWRRRGMIGLPEYVQTYPWLVADPTNPDHAFAGMRGDIPSFGVKTLLQETTDGGLTWTNDLKSLYEKFHTSGLVEMLALLLGGELCQPVFDPADPTVLYAGKKGGVLKSSDGGASWSTLGVGLEIPWVQSMFAPRHGGTLFAGTPGGLYLSKDGGKTWQDGHLWCQFIKNTRREIGGAAYIDAYWRARYYGLIDDQTANAPIEK